MPVSKNVFQNLSAAARGVAQTGQLRVPIGQQRFAATLLASSEAVLKHTLSPSLSAVILWFAWVVEVEPRPEGVGAPPSSAVGICLVLVLFFALGDLVIGDLIFAGFFAVVLSLLIVPDELPDSELR